MLRCTRFCNFLNFLYSVSMMLFSHVGDIGTAELGPLGAFPGKTTWVASLIKNCHSGFGVGGGGGGW